MVSVSVRELRTKLAFYLDQVSRGETVEIIRRSNIIAVIEPKGIGATRQKPKESKYPTVRTVKGVVVFRDFEQRDEERLSMHSTLVEVEDPSPPYVFVLAQLTFSRFIIGEYEDGRLAGMGGTRLRETAVSHLWTDKPEIREALMDILTKRV